MLQPTNAKMPNWGVLAKGKWPIQGKAWCHVGCTLVTPNNSSGQGTSHVHTPPNLNEKDFMARTIPVLQWLTFRLSASARERPDSDADVACKMAVRFEQSI